MSNSKVLFVLQNAWRREASPGERDWDDETWELALWQCQTGKRLREYIPDGVAFKVINASRDVANNGKAVYSADLDHVTLAIYQYSPDVVVLLGVEAQRLRRELYDVRILSMAHPCWRELSKVVTAAYREDIDLAIATGAGCQVNWRRDRSPVP